MIVEILGVVFVVYLMVYKGLYVMFDDFIFLSGMIFMLLEMFEVVLEDGVDIINNFWGGDGGVSLVGFVYEDIFVVMDEVGVVMVFFVGNEGFEVIIIGCFGCLKDVLIVVVILINCLFVNEVMVDGDISIGVILVFYFVGNVVIIFISFLMVFVIYVGEIDEVNIEGCLVYVDDFIFENVIVLIS